MSKHILSKVIGQLNQDKTFQDWWTSEKVSIPFLEGFELPVTFMDLEPEADLQFIPEADDALSNFLSLNVQDRNAISQLVYENCMGFLNEIGYDPADEALWHIKDVNDIWKHVHSTDIYLNRRHRRDQDIYLSITAECDWEQEHGLQLVFRKGKMLTRISDQDGHLTEADAYDKPDEEDTLLYAYLSRN
ncbi:DUF6985 domain-containing protein [Pedobacter sp. GR22-6]|uniref:DUF6985 domain-containing protein n=1 Tax=Pedobacter sp. GR22-6 TaxID=3127957 RepID=UPI00307F0A67